MAQIHRFRDCAAVWLGNGGETTYLTAAQARLMARALVKVAKSIEREDFAQSFGLACAITTQGPGYPHGFTQPRKGD